MTDQRCNDILIRFWRKAPSAFQPPSPHMSISQVARAMCYTNSNVYRLMRNKKMPFPVYREEGKQLYCLRSDVEQWLQNCDDDTEEWEQTHQERVHQAWIV